MPEDLKPQIPLIRKLLEAYRIPTQELVRYEADDVLGTLAAKASAAGFQVVLVSADKDLMQLVTDHVQMYHTGRDKLYTPALVEEDFGVPPSQVVDVLALMGDASDNVPGVPGIGEKGAKKLIQEYGSLENLLDHAAEIQRKSYREGLQQHRDKAEMSKELVTIHTDLDAVAFDPEALKLEEPDYEALKEVLRELEFFSLLDELESSHRADELAASIPVATEATDVAAWQARVGELPAGPVTVALVGKEGEPPLGIAVSLAVRLGDGDGDGDGDGVLFADFRREGVQDAVAATLSAWCADPEREIHGHDLKEILRLLGAEAPIGAILRDAMLLSYVLQPALRHGLPELCFERLHYKLMSPEEAGWGKTTAPQPGHGDLLRYAGEQAEVTRRLVPLLHQALEEATAQETPGEDVWPGWNLERVYHDIEAPLTPVLMRMEERGIPLDIDFLRAMAEELGADIAALDGEIIDLAGERFNINSPQQLGVILFEKLGYPVLRRTRKTKSYATGAEVLEELASRGYPLPEKILRYRELAKLKSTYVDALPELVAADGRIHTRFNQAVAATGRLSSANPNLQNIPVRTPLGQRIRRAFVAPPGYRLLVADYSQVELRVLAHIAGEGAMQEAFHRGEDIHRATAANVFGIDPSMVSGEQRRAAKTINFGIIYGISAFGLARNLGIPKKQADEFIHAYLDRYPGVGAYVEETKAAAEKEGKVSTLYGRVRYLADIRSKNRALRENAERMAINARIQGTAADILKLAMIAIDRRLRQGGHTARLLLTVHDELVLEVPEDAVDATAALVKEEMENVAPLAVPLVVDVGAGVSWYEAK